MNDARLVAEELAARILGNSSNGHAADGVVEAFVRLSAVEERDVSWFWKDRIPWGSVTLIAGDGAVGKSTFAQDLGGYLTRGQAPPGGGEVDRSRGLILLSGEEDASAVIRPRMRLAGINLERVMVLNVEDAGFTLPSGMPRLSELCREEDAGIVIVDPGPAFLDKDLRGNTEEEIRRMMRPLRGLAEELRLAVIVICHLNKRDGGDSRQRVMGGAAWVNASRSVLYVGAPPGQDPRETGDRFVAVEKSNLGAYPPASAFTISSADEDIRYARVIWGEEVPGIRSADLVAPQETHEARSAREEAMEFLQEELYDGPAPVTDLRKAAQRDGHSWRTVERAKRALGVKAEKSALAGGWKWSLPQKDAITPPLSDVAVLADLEDRHLSKSANENSLFIEDRQKGRDGRSSEQDRQSDLNDDDPDSDLDAIFGSVSPGS